MRETARKGLIAVSVPHNDPFCREHFRANLLVYTRKAFAVLPRLDRPRILDIGCGSGVATLELARISGGTVVAVDIDRKALARLTDRATRERLADRISVMCASMTAMNVPAAGFDIVWSEGSIPFIGFERGLREWSDLLAPGGYLVVHDELRDVQRKLALSETCAYTVLAHFDLSPETWWREYFEPMKRRLAELHIAELHQSEIAEEVRLAEREIEAFDSQDGRFGSFFLVLRKVR